MDSAEQAISIKALEDGKDREHEELYLELEVEEDGFIEVYLAHNKGKEVLFDDYKIEHLMSLEPPQARRYRYGFNGMERLDNWNGKGNALLHKPAREVQIDNSYRHRKPK